MIPLTGWKKVSKTARKTSFFALFLVSFLTLSEESQLLKVYTMWKISQRAFRNTPKMLEKVYLDQRYRRLKKTFQCGCIHPSHIYNWVGVFVSDKQLVKGGTRTREDHLVSKVPKAIFRGKSLWKKWKWFNNKKCLAFRGVPNSDFICSTKTLCIFKMHPFIKYFFQWSQLFDFSPLCWIKCILKTHFCM